MRRILYPALAKILSETSERVGSHASIEGDVDAIGSVEMVDQNPIGKSSRSNPVTYVKAYDDIRDLFASQKLSKIRGFSAQHFSFNVDKGRCPVCKGDGEVVVQMQFMADVHLECEACGGKRFKREVLEVRYQDKNISDILEMTVDQAIDFPPAWQRQDSRKARTPVRCRSGLHTPGAAGIYALWRGSPAHKTRFVPRQRESAGKDALYFRRAYYRIAFPRYKETFGIVRFVDTARAQHNRDRTQS